VNAPAEFLDRPAHSFDAVVGIGNEARPSFRRVAHLTEIMRHGFLLVLRGILARPGKPRKVKLAGELGNYAPEKKRVQEKMKKVENFS
jgi:hypothetical protein